MTTAELIEMVKHHGEGTGITMSAGPLKLILFFRGSWNPQESYTFFDLVEYQNEVYVSTRYENRFGIEPGTDSKTWTTFDEFYNHCHKGESEDKEE